MKVSSLAAAAPSGKDPGVARALVLSAGFGTRLRPLTDELPKPLLPLGDRSLLEHAFTALSEAGLGPDVVVNTHHLASEFERRRGSFSLQVHLLYEPSIRGTAGGIAGARALFDPGPVVVVLADAVLERVPAGFAESAADGGMVLAVARRPRGMGPLGVSEDGGIVRLRGRTFGNEAAGGEYVGLLALGEETLRQLPGQGCYIRDYALPLLTRGGRIKAFPYDHSYTLPGDNLSEYLEQNLRWLDRQGVGDRYLGQHASVGPGVQLARALIGDDATVEGEGIVQSTVVFPGARARAPLSRSIVTVNSGVIKAI